MTVLTRFTHGARSVVFGAGLVVGLSVTAGCDSSDDANGENDPPEGSAGSGGAGASGGAPSATGGAAGTPGSAGSGGADPGAGGEAGNGGTAGTNGGYGGADAGYGGGAEYPDAGPDACASLGALEPPTVPDPQLEPPDGTTLLYRLRAEGDQIYKCTATPAGDAGFTYAWTLKAPSASLYDDTCTQVGTHYAGPTWEWSSDHSTAVGTRLFGATVEADSIQWLLLQATDNSATGVFSDVTYVQRTHTEGGLAPANDTCTGANVDAEQAIPYSAYYYFYVGP